MSLEDRPGERVSGWRVSEVKLPKLAEKHDARVLAQAEVEL